MNVFWNKPIPDNFIHIYTLLYQPASTQTTLPICAHLIFIHSFTVLLVVANKYLIFHCSFSQ